MSKSLGAWPIDTGYNSFRVATNAKSSISPEHRLNHKPVPRFQNNSEQNSQTFEGLISPLK